jgi:myo-inositol 2-dehydrogenase/D-chiro-inositol 1-dehydrogenase
VTGKRIGVLGLGRVGVMHARNLAQSSDVDEVVLIGRDQSRLDLATAQVSAALTPGAPADIAGALADPGVAPAGISSRVAALSDALWGLDGLVIATSTETHPDFAVQAAQMGVPVLVEKPLALDLTVLEDTTAKLEDTCTPVMVAFHRRYDPAHRALREKVRSGELGTLRVVTATDHDHTALSPAYIPLSGGIWRDLVIHDFDIIPFVTGDRIVAVTAAGSVLDAPVHGEHGDVDTATALLELASGAIATVSATRRNDAGQDVRLQVFGSAATFATGVDGRTPVTSLESGGVQPSEPYRQFIDRFEPAFRNEIAAFLGLIDGTHANDTPPRAGVDALRVAIAAAVSVSSGGRRITIDDITEGQLT